MESMKSSQGVSLIMVKKKVHIDGLVHERRNSIANALELHLSCTKPLICTSPAEDFAIDDHERGIHVLTLGTP